MKLKLFSIWEMVFEIRVAYWCLEGISFGYDSSEFPMTKLWLNVHFDIVCWLFHFKSLSCSKFISLRQCDVLWYRTEILLYEWIQAKAWLFPKLKVSNNPETQDSYHISEVRLGPNWGIWRL